MKYKGKEYNRVFYVGTIYVLLLYLCYSSVEEIKSTFFIFAYGISKDITNRFKGRCAIFDESRIKNKIVLFLLRKYRTAWLVYKFFILLKIPQIKKKDTFFAQDHLTLSKYLCSRDYILFEDSPGLFSNIDSSGYRKRQISILPIKQSKKNRFLYGHNDGMEYALSSHCRKIILTKEDNSEYIANIPKEYIDIHQCWNSFSEEKKSLILYIYDFTNSDLNNLKNRDIVIFTQPLNVDFLTDEEHYKVYSKIISKYPPDRTLIKTHPRDTFDYRKQFPNYTFFSKPIPSQLLEMIGIKFKKIVTVNSSSVCNCDYPVDIDWYGENDIIIRKMGEFLPPINANICKF